MPLLGRHKSLPAGSRGSGPAQSPAQPQQQQSGAASQQLVCQSPLFGIRRQLPIATAVMATEAISDNSVAGNSGARAPGPAAQAARHKRVSIGASKSYSGGQTSFADDPLRRQQQQQQQQQQPPIANQLVLLPIDSDHELGSIPQNITSQQIHYAFSIMDTNSDGLIDLRDMSQMLANLGVPIDEAILSHVISTVSKRGDRLISEPEFLSWIGNFIQVSEEPAPTSTRQARARPPRAAASSSLAAAGPEAPAANLRQRRGSGSGLALMRSLSAGAGSSPGAGPGPATSQAGGAAATSGGAAAQRASQEREARNDLRAAFCVFDLDGDGFITLDEVRAGLKLLGESWSQAELQQLFDSCQGSPASPTTSKATRGARKQQQQQSGPKSEPNKQRISIDDFVRLLM